MENNIQPNSEGLGVEILTDKESLQIANQVVVATNCLYRNYHLLGERERRGVEDTDGIRGDLAIELFKKAIELGLHVVVADGGSSSDFVSILEKLEKEGLEVVSAKIPGRAPQRRAAFEFATTLPSAKVIIYTQPEKCSLLDHFAKLVKPILEDKADIVIPQRNSYLFRESYPDYMRESEIRVNATYDRLMRKVGLMGEDENFDWFFGPVVFKNDPEIVSLFLNKYGVDKKESMSRINARMDPEKNSGSHYLPVIEALYKKRRVRSVEVAFFYPASQRDNEMSEQVIELFKQRRREDAITYLLEAIHLLASLYGDPESKIKKVSTQENED